MNYGTISPLYAWGDLLPLPTGKKHPVPAGYTGGNGAAVGDKERGDWAGRDGNYALRLPEGVMGIDVDTYGDKDGAATLAELEAKLGPLPATYMSTRRANPMTSGIRFFRYTGGKLAGGAGKDIDIIQRGHRYAVVWPSVVEADGADAAYAWYGPSGLPAALPPELEMLAELPAAWVEHLSTGASTYSAAPASADTTSTFLADMTADERPACLETTRTMKHWLERFETLADGSHHDTMMKALHAVTRTCAAGHSGYAESKDQLQGAWEMALGGERMGEFHRMAEGSLSKAASEHPRGYAALEGNQHECPDPVTGMPSQLAAMHAAGEVTHAAASGGGVATLERTEVEVGESMVPDEDMPDFLDSGAGGGDDGGGNNDGGGDGGGDDQDTEPDTSWIADLIVDDKTGLPKPLYVNTSLIMANDPVLSGLGVNTMGGTKAWRVLPPWRRNHPDVYQRKNIDITDADMLRCYERLRSYFGGGHGSLKREACDEAIGAYAAQNAFTPWVDHITALPAWDGTPRIERAIPTVEDTSYSRQALLNFFLGLMQRAHEPGCKLDSMLVLWGAQGDRKTSWLRAIVPSDNMYEEMESIPDSDRHKDRLAACHRAAVVNFDELDKMRRKDDQAALKAFITGTKDTWRAPYGRVNETHGRRFVLAGTTNQKEFLLDVTGNRRYWPLSVKGKIPAEYLSREFMDLLLAEARDRYVRGERVDYSQEFEDLANDVRGQNVHDPVGEAIDEWLDNPTGVPVAGGVGKLPVGEASLAMLVDNVPALEGVDLLRDKAMSDRISGHMDTHPEYIRRDVRKTVGGRRAKTYWERVQP